MKINQVLVEAQGATVAFAFGRFNPAHQGHIEVWRAVEQAGANWFIGTNPSTLGPNDPLTFQQKSAWMEEIYPPIAGHIVPEQSVLTLAAYIFKKLRKNERATVAYITDATDWAWSGKLLNQYNGVEGSHGYYKFAQIIHEPSPRVSSATALRDAARADDKVAFYHASGTDPKAKVAGLTYFDTVKQACEKYPLPVKRVKKVKESILNELTYTKPEVQQSPKTGKFWAWVFNNKGEKVAFVGDTAEEALKKLNAEVLDKHNTKISNTSKVNTNSTYSTWITGDVAKNKAGIDKSVSEVWVKLEPESLIISTSPITGFRKARGGSLHPGGGFQFNLKGSELEQLGLKPSNRYEVSLADQSADGSTSKFKITHHSYYYDSGDKLQGGTNSLPLMVVQQTGRNSVAETEQKTVAKTWDQMTPQEKISGVKGRTVWNEKTRKYYTVFDVPAKEVDEASLATMRDYFAGDENAHDPYEITKQRLHFAKDANAKANMQKRFRSQAEYDLWLKQNKLRQISGVKEDEEAGEVEQQGQLIPFPAGTTKVHVSDVYDWYKLGQVISDLDDADPNKFGQGAPQSIIAFGSEEEESKLMPLLKRLGLKIDDIDPEGTDELGEAYHAGSLYEMLKKERTKGWALTNKRK